MRRTRLHWLVPFVVLGMFVLMAASASAATRIELNANLSGSSSFPGVDGKARFRSSGGERELQVELEDANRLAGKTLTVFVDGNSVGKMTVNNLGNARLNRNSDRGQTVPNIQSGAKVTVKTGAGVLVASGTFR